MGPWARRSLQAVAGVIALSAGLQLYCVWPARFAVRPLAPDPDARHLILVFHGSGGGAEPTILALADRLREVAASDVGTTVVRYNWAPFSDSRLRTHPNGARLGEQLGDDIANFVQLKSVHLIAHSAGAYVIEPLCRSYRAATAGRRGGTARVRMTYLDPIGFRGPLDPGWGARHYGRCADEAEAFINTDDPAPATAARLRHARTTDVTADPARTEFGGGGHRWPVQFYINSLAAPGATMGRRPERDEVKRGR